MRSQAPPLLPAPVGGQGNELEYPVFADDLPDPDEVREALRLAWEMVSAAERPLPGLGLC